MLKKVFVYFLIFVIIIISTLFAFLLTYRTNYLNLVNNNLEIVNNINLNSSLVLSIIKNESKFKKDAVSSKEAIGLMQLTFSTAKEVANNNGFDINISDLKNANMNIKLGILYLEYLFNIFEDKNLVILSYNAGPNRVKQWIENNEIYKDNKINTPYKETNAYYYKIIKDEKVYNFLLKENK